MSKYLLSPAEQEASEALAALKSSATTETSTPKKEKKEKAPRKVTRADKVAAAATTKKTKKKAAPAPVTEELLPQPAADVDPSPVQEELPPPAPEVDIQPEAVAVPVQGPLAEPAVFYPVPEAPLPSYFSSRHNRASIRNMMGVFLTLLDANGKILMFLAGAFRSQRIGAGQECDEVLSIGTEDILRAVSGIRPDGSRGEPYRPTARVHLLENGEKSPWRLDTMDYDAGGGPRRGILREIPSLTSAVIAAVPEARRWGLFNVFPSPTKPFVRGLPNGMNSEFFLNPVTWRETEQLPNDGMSSFADRLAPNAIHYANTLASAWHLATAAASLYGGMTGFPPPYEGGKDGRTQQNSITLPGDPAVSAMLMREKQWRTARTARGSESSMVGSNLRDIMMAATAAANATGRPSAT
jgi:hypothetical protein